MSSLCVEYRPKSWAEVVGQNTIVSILSRQIATKSWKNSYLFCGPHGCGKTSVARLFANFVNNGEGSPIEIDAASNNGVENIRQLIVDAQQSSLDCDYKVYIIDECHQLTKAAWDAALKLIEEPPSCTIFIFCTTNPSKLPSTILSRVQRFDFNRVSHNVISGRLAYILNTSSTIKFSQVALDRISIIADGHVRDAIQLLDKCIDFMNDDDTLDILKVEEALGLPSYEAIIRMVNALIDKDIVSAVTQLDYMKSTTCDMIRLYDDVLKYAIDVALLSKGCHINSLSIPEGYTNLVKTDVKINEILVNRLVFFRHYVNHDNAEVLLKTIFMEVCA